MKWALWLLCVGCGGSGATGWWSVGDPVDPESESFDDEDDGDFDEDDVDDERGAWGELALVNGQPTAEGYVGYFESTANGGVHCDMEYAVTAIQDASGCGDCEVAVELTLGELDIWEDDGACGRSGWTDQTRLAVGYSGNSLYLRSSGSWRVAGESEFEGDMWEFYLGEEGEDD